MNQQSRAMIIAEAGVNHNGNVDQALALIEAAAATGSDVVKFQAFRASRLVTRAVSRARYQEVATGSSGSQHAMLRQLELSELDFHTLNEACQRAGIEFMATPFDEACATFLVKELGQRMIKVGSGDLTNGPLLHHIARLGRPIILSTGMSTLTDIESALAVIAHGYLIDAEPTGLADCLALYPTGEAQDVLRRNVFLLQCTTEYPAAPDTINLRAMGTLARAFGLPVGFSDHSKGIHISAAAIAMGACIIEKHLTLDNTLPGPDHKASLEPEHFRAMVEAIRDTEAALGTGIKAPHLSELSNRTVVRRAVVAASNIAAGDRFSANNMVVKRSSHGAAAFCYWGLVGKVATRSYAYDEPIEQ